MRTRIGTTVRRIIGIVAVAPLALFVFAAGAVGSASAAEAPVGLGLLGTYAVLGGETVTNEGLSVVTGNVGVSPGSAITGFLPGIVLGGVKHAATTEAAGARAAFTTAYDDAAGRSPTEVGIVDLVNRNLVAGVYSGGALALTGTLTLTGDASSVFIFQATSSLITSSNSVVALDGVSPCNVFWQVLSSATIGSGSVFVGTIFAGASITADSGTKVTGRLLAGSGQVELHNNVINRPTGCDIGDDDADGDGVIDADDGDTDGDGDVDASDGDVDGDGVITPADDVNGDGVITAADDMNGDRIIDAADLALAAAAAPRLPATGVDPTAGVVLSGLLLVGGLTVVLVGARSRRKQTW
jgi:LPXTG-motif cell wall-anchored protein